MSRPKENIAMRLMVIVKTARPQGEGGMMPGEQLIAEMSNTMKKQRHPSTFVRLSNR